MVKDKIELCTSKLSDFKSIQGVGEFPLYKRYDVLKNIIDSEVEERFWHFLSQPVVKGDTIIWHCVPFEEMPRHLNKLSGEEKKKYDGIKAATIEHYNNVIAKFRKEEKAIELEYIEKALKSIDDRFIYCFDEKVILGIWGMKPKPNNNRISGEYITDLFVSKPKYTITFIVGEKGTTNGLLKITKEKDSIISKEEIPSISVKGENEFVGWDENPLNYLVKKDKTFNAQYKDTPLFIAPPDPPSIPDDHKVTFSAGENGVLLGNPVLKIRNGKSLTISDIPKVKAKDGYIFKAWDQTPDGYQVNSNTNFIAQYEKTDVPSKRGFWSRLLAWLLLIPPTLSRWMRALWASRLFRWLIWLLLLLLLVWLLSLLLKDCRGINNHSGNERNGIENDPGGGGNGHGNNPGSDYGSNPGGGRGDGQGGGYEFLPGDPGVIIPIDSADFEFSKDSLTRIVADRLNILLEGDATVPQFAKDFKLAYPSDEYQIVYYDTLIKRLQIRIPPQEREIIKKELPLKLSNYKLFIWDETLFESAVDFNDPALKDRKKSWYIDACQVREAWNITRGKSDVVIAIVDDGFNLKHPEFEGKIVNAYNVWSKNNNVYPSDLGHGTHVAGIALAIGNNGIGIVGIAPNCKFMPVQVADERGNMTITSVVDGILYAIYSGADVINVSLGLSLTYKSTILPPGTQYSLIHNNYKEEERLWKEVFRIADKHNTTIVVAAGNENILAGIDPMQRPSQAITVSAVDKSNNPYSKSTFSNFGDYSTLSAPGVQIYSTYGNDSYEYLDGTSMATPIVTGAVALLKSTNSEFTTATIKNVLVSTGIPVRGNVGNLIQLGKALHAVADGKLSNEDCDKIILEIDSLQKEIDKRLLICPGVLKKNALK